MNRIQQVKSKKRVADHGEVFTNEREVNAMLDLVSDMFIQIDKTFLEPACGDGNFLIEILKRKLSLLDKYRRCSKTNPHCEKYGKGLVQAVCSLYGIDLLPDNVACCRDRLFYYIERTNPIGLKKSSDYQDVMKTIRFILEKNIICGNALDNKTSSNQPIIFTHWIHTDNQIIQNHNPCKGVQFDVIIGNPPYQLSDGGAKASAKPIYHLFIEQAIKMEPHYVCMIVPSRWFSGGKGLSGFRRKMLNDKRLKELHDYPHARDVFSDVEIKGGVNYFLWEDSYNGDCLVKTYEEHKCISAMKRPLKEKNTDIFMRINGAIPILRKIQSFTEESFSKLVSSRKPFGLATNFKDFTPYKTDNSVKIYAHKNIGYVKIDAIPLNRQWIKEHKIIIPYAIGSGNSKTDRVNPMYAEPGSCCTETYLVVGTFTTKKQCRNVMSYINTKFFHFCLTLIKNTQHTTRITYQFVPQQNFDEQWTDEKLYKKYALTDDEINFIEKMIRPMD